MFEHLFFFERSLSPLTQGRRFLLRWWCNLSPSIALEMEPILLSIILPDAIRASFLSDSIVSVVGVDDEVLVGVMGRFVVGDHTAGDTQETHH